MDTEESLNHSVWECKYHVVFIPSCRRKTIYGHLRRWNSSSHHAACGRCTYPGPHSVSFKRETQSAFAAPTPIV
jgi:hypothetical protein